MTLEQSGLKVEASEAAIKGFFGDYRWLSNFHLCKVLYEGVLYPSSENAYQAAKCDDLKDRWEFTNISPSAAKNLGRKVAMTSDWEDTKLSIMYKILCDKFSRNEDLTEKLLETGHKHLEETNYWKDTFWGVYNGDGANHLGRILMLIRSELKSY